MLFSKPVSKNAAAVVTGAGSGIGRGLAVEIAKRGGRVVCADINLKSAKETVALIGRKQAHALQVDVTQLEEIEAMADASAEWLGDTPDLVVNNAGVAAGDPIGVMPIEDWKWVIDINMWGMIYGCHVFTPRLVEAGRGAILNVASSAAFGAAPGMGAYNVSKAAVLALSETLAAEVAGRGVRVGVLCPTFVKTNIVNDARGSRPMMEIADKLMARIGMTPEQVAKYTFDALDKNEFYILPQADAKLFWFMKRHFPLGYTRFAGGIRRISDKFIDV